MTTKLKAALQSMDKATEASKSTDHLRALREWRMAATLRFTGKSLAVAKKRSGK